MKKYLKNYNIICLSKFTGFFELCSWKALGKRFTPWNRQCPWTNTPEHIFVQNGSSLLFIYIVAIKTT